MHSDIIQSLEIVDKYNNTETNIGSNYLSNVDTVPSV